jgi:hypothetical protein
MGRMAILKVGAYDSATFPINNGTPQRSPLSPILSALYMSPMLWMIQEWRYCDLTLYVDDGAIYLVSTSVGEVIDSARAGLSECLTWLDHNSLVIDTDKTELIIFTIPRASPHLVGSILESMIFTDPKSGRQCVKPSITSDTSVSKSGMTSSGPTMCTK